MKKNKHQRQAELREKHGIDTVLPSKDTSEKKCRGVCLTTMPPLLKGVTPINTIGAKGAVRWSEFYKSYVLIPYDKTKYMGTELVLDEEEIYFY